MSELYINYENESVLREKFQESVDELNGAKEKIDLAMVEIEGYGDIAPDTVNILQELSEMRSHITSEVTRLNYASIDTKQLFKSAFEAEEAAVKEINKSEGFPLENYINGGSTYNNLKPDSETFKTNSVIACVPGSGAQGIGQKSSKTKVNKMPAGYSEKDNKVKESILLEENEYVKSASKGYSADVYIIVKKDSKGKVISSRTVSYPTNLNFYKAETTKTGEVEYKSYKIEFDKEK